MDRILRSVVQIGGVPEAEDALQNWMRLQEYSLDFLSIEDKKVSGYLNDFYGQMSHPPDFRLVIEYFEKKDDIDTVARLQEIQKAQPFIKTNFLAIVRSEQEAQQSRNMVRACRDAVDIVEHGKNLDKPVNGKKVIKGVPDAINFLYDKLHTLIHLESGEKLEGVITEDANEFIEDYEKTEKTNKLRGRNLLGLEPVDEICKGHRLGELWTHAAFTGELKSSLAINYAYNNAVVYGKNMFYAILEMTYKQLRNQIYALHSSHGKFVTAWHKEDNYIGLDYRKIRDGELSSRDKERLIIVAQDFKVNTKGKLFIWRPTDDVGVEDIRRKAEMFHNKYGCDGLIIDHLGLCKSKYKSNDYVTSLNAIIRETKLTALNFARGRGVPIFSLFQINRQGKLRADKNDGRYDFAAIQYANEVEKSSDVVTYTYLNDALRSDGKFYMGNLKNREGPIFERMIGKIIWQSRRMRALQSNLIDMTNDRILAASRTISMSASDLL